MAQGSTGGDVAGSVDALTRAIQEFRDELKIWTPAAAPPSTEALDAAKRFRDVRRGLQLRLPLELAAEAASASDIKLTWSVDEPDITPNKLLRGRPGDNKFDPLADVGANERTYTDSKLSAHTTYRYKVTAPAPGGQEFFAIAEATTKS